MLTYDDPDRNDTQADRDMIANIRYWTDDDVADEFAENCSSTLGILAGREMARRIDGGYWSLGMIV